MAFISVFCTFLTDAHGNRTIFKWSSASLHVPACLSSGQIGMMLCVKAEPGHELMDPRQPRQQVPACPDSVETPALRYYTPDVHRSAFYMPKFAADALESSLTFH
ncbi:hypothetical protein DUNSADRAFT_14910 [Dunaliella salina]|uniref:Spermidine synthase n=1 Tax=Dunaliella salina TaxID=3046 RepID=A0ABZ3KM05_DUNSA|nr:hypothetical protein DUNSADRAFT_14910 [Dunaliella salina]|eukprot:KAF5830203.1 hypothetical protein DUNSADRAFT_14910 [Dunaliella salina]